ncbi:MAG TPA: hypothetical protein QGH10_23950 [Armatimonadota bacterium]|nr:hypothetical protein [Armatimonadota bacterium]
MKRSLLMLLVPALLGLLLAPGCKKEVANEPSAVAQAFADAMGDGDTKAASKLWNYVIYAREQNGDWDDIPSGQRSGIIGKMQDTKATEIAAWASYFSEGMIAGPPTTRGSEATVAVTNGPQGEITLDLAEADGEWGVTRCTPK